MSGGGPVTVRSAAETITGEGEELEKKENQWGKGGSEGRV